MAIHVTAELGVYRTGIGEGFLLELFDGGSHWFVGDGRECRIW
jgi:hypothetical protein